MSATREEILRTLKARGTATIADLTEFLGMSSVSVRHHLSTLQAEGLVTATEARHGVGRPHLTYVLTEAALERFPAKYLRLSGRLLDELKTSLSADQIEALFARMASGMVAEYKTRLKGKSLEKKMALLIEMLGEEGFLAEWKHSGETISLTEYNCPYMHVGQRHPEVCTIDLAMISEALSAEVEKTTCVLDGAERCVFVITPNKSASVANS